MRELDAVADRKSRPRFYEREAKFAEETRLSDAGLATHQHETAPRGIGLSSAFVQVRVLSISADEATANERADDHKGKRSLGRAYPSFADARGPADYSVMS